jgi:hypothetical protein
MYSSNLSSILRMSLYVFALLTVAAGISFVLNGKGTTTVFAQQDPFLNQRINRIEQQFSSIETRISRIEQQSRFTDVTPRTSLNRDTEINLMRSQIEALQLRIAEIECGVVRVDERTLSTTARQSRKRATPNENDRCRLNPNVPLELSTRP